MVFRSWYDFGGGCIADMGIYSLWPVFTALNLGPPLSARAWATHTCDVVDSVGHPDENDFSFPTASVIQFEYAARPDMPALDVFWYDGGMQPRIPELDSETAALPPEGMLYVGDKGKILSAGGAPRLITAKGSAPLVAGCFRGAQRRRRTGARLPLGPGAQPRPTTHGCRPSKARSVPPGDFLNAGPISETVCLAAVALRAGKAKSGSRTYPAPIKVLYDSASMKITNLADANKYLTREYRQGWEL